MTGEMMGRELMRSPCWSVIKNCGGRCPGCQVTLDWNLMGRRCACGDKATGYRALAADAPVEFFCDIHFQGVPSPMEAAP